MRHLVFLGPGRLEWQEVPDPEIGEARDALVRPLAVALCDADVALLRGLFPAAPGSFGHEFVAEVLEIGDGVTEVRPGDIVAAPVQISCGSCERCRRGRTAWCRSVAQPAAFGLGAFGGNWPGAFSDILRVPFANHMLVRVPKGVEPKHVASAGDNISDAWRTVVPYLRESPGAEVLVVGGGSIGLYAAAIASVSGASRVDYVDDDADRLKLAGRLGVHVIEGAITGERLGTYPIVVDATFGNSKGLRSAIRSVAPGGVCASVFPGFEDVSLPGFTMWQRAVRLVTGVAHCRSHLPEVLDLVQSGRLHPELVNTESIPWEAAAEALAHPSTKPLVVRQGA